MSTMNMSTKYESHVAFTKQKTISTKVWDGYLQLNSALTVSAIAFFKSGEKMPDVKWTESVEVKGKVKLHDFERYIQDLTRSPNRGLMIVSLNWKEGSSKLKWNGVKTVAKKYVDDERVGLAKIVTGVDLYVCPCSDKILTLLQKYGFFKFNDKTTIDENKDHLIGCVVWKRNLINHPNSIHRMLSVESSRKSCPIEVWSPIRTPLELLTKNEPSLDDVRNEKGKHVSCITSKEPYKKYLSSFSDLIKSEDIPNVLSPVSAKLETSNLDLSLKPPVRHVLESNATTVTKQSSPIAILQKEQVLSEFDYGASTTCHQNFHKRMMEEDMDISPQKKACCRDDNENHLANQTKNMSDIHLIEPNFIPPLPAVQIHPPVLIPKNDFTYLGPILMREQTYSYTPINLKPDFTYLGPILMREQEHANEKNKK